MKNKNTGKKSALLKRFRKFQDAVHKIMDNNDLSEIDVFKGTCEKLREEVTKEKNNLKETSNETSEEMEFKKVLDDILRVIDDASFTILNSLQYRIFYMGRESAPVSQ